jgi:hypothetical protein
MKYRNERYPGGVVELKAKRYRASIEYTQSEIDSPSTYSEVRTETIGEADTLEDAWELIRSFRMCQKVGRAR